MGGGGNSSEPNAELGEPMMYLGRRDARRNPESHWTEPQRAAAARLWPDKIADPANMINANGKPIFDCSFNHRYEITEKEMTDTQKLAYKQYLLYKATLKVDRRDTVYQAFATSDFTNMSAAHNWLGAPYPVIEPNPTPGELLYTIRWYEHLGAFTWALAFYGYTRAKPSVRFSAALISAQRGCFFWSWFMLEGGLGMRAMSRLQGKCENEFECNSYGVLENQDRLKEKVRFWEKYRAYKEEWMKRYDYYVFGMRPGERYTFFSPCHLPPVPVVYGQKTDFPLRKNPFVLSSQPITKTELEKLRKHFREHHTHAPTPREFHAPELKYYNHGLGDVGFRT